MRRIIALLILVSLFQITPPAHAAALNDCAPYVRMPVPGADYWWVWELSAQFAGRYQGHAALRCIYTPMGRNITDVPNKDVRSGCSLFVAAPNRNGRARDWWLTAAKFGPFNGRTALKCIYLKFNTVS